MQQLDDPILDLLAVWFHHDPAQVRAHLDALLAHYERSAAFYADLEAKIVAELDGGRLPEFETVCASDALAHERERVTQLAEHARMFLDCHP
jgi:hypothetical protein